MLSRFAPVARRATAFIAPRIATYAAKRLAVHAVVTQIPRYFSSPAPLKSIGATVKTLRNEIRNFDEDMVDLDTFTKERNAQVEVDYQTGDIKVTLPGRNCTVDITYNMEFEYPNEDENENQEEYRDERDQEVSRGDETSNEEDTSAFHRIDAVITPLNSTKSIKASGTVNLKGEFIIDSIVPRDGEKSLRTIAAADLSEAAIENVEITIEETFLDSNTCNFLIRAARNYRIQGHIQSLTAAADVFQALK